MEKIKVVAAVIRRSDAFLLCQRPFHKRHGGLWEFPGGKVDAGESIEGALCRELREELGVRVTSVGDTLFVETDPGSPFEINFIEVTISGAISVIEHERVEWVTISDCWQYTLAPSDAAFVEHYARLTSPRAVFS
jgi:8-oxo-dGTP diphosphatase